MSSIVGQEFLIVAVGVPKGQEGVGKKDALLTELKRQSALQGSEATLKDVMKFEVPDSDRSLIFGSFDNLIRLTDDLAKADSQIDSVLHRIERQLLEMDPKAAFTVTSQRQTVPFLNYMKGWKWDEGKFPRTKSISDLWPWVMQKVNNMDEDVRNKTTQYNEYKTQKGNLSKKEGANLAGKDLIDVLTPEVVKAEGGPDDDFISTEHLITLPIIIPRGCDEEFLKTYETFADKVVPMSARKFQGQEDKDGNTLWRVVMFRSAAEAFKKACREKRYTVRDFEFSKDGYRKLEEQRKQVEDSVKKQRELVFGMYQATWSDVMVSWMHIKAMRVFVESVLRFGMPPSFGAFVLSPKGDIAAARKALADVLGKQAGSLTTSMAEDKGDGDDEFFPYVSLSFTPFNCARDK